ncbi:histone H1 [Shewanella sp. NFH-SH190041]|uniref:phage portal protein n=1 Tax=Shewanella sp. NFH-SH190041 TaxID=2950245 RepID=UPI0021C4115D|nr:phage portal protein [Shewanella sp. NFH-SH190041]BDM64547.1 histone H1 [Shewanella sp. NFH-SH190041]
MFEMLFRSAPSGENPAVPLSELASDSWLCTGAVSENTALTLSAVYACIGVLGRSMGQLPLHVMRKVDGEVVRATDHPAYYLLHDEPNQWQTSYSWRETSMFHLGGWGNSYSYIKRSRKGEIRSLEFLKPIEVALMKSNSGRYVYRVTNDELGQAGISPFDMLHIKAIGADSKIGKSPITQCRESFALGLAAQNYGNQFFAGGGRPTAIVSAKSALNKDSWGILKDAWKSAKNALKRDDNTTLLLPTELEYKSLTIPPEDAQFLDTRKFNRSEIAGIYNVPAHMINDLEKATFSNISEQAIQFVRHTMTPWIVNYEQEINRKVFTEAERKAGYYVKFNLNGLLRGTAKERAEFYTKGIRDGWMSRNEVRALEEMNRVDGLDDFILSADLQPKQPEAVNE